jgi:hypothetical protein
MAKLAKKLIKLCENTLRTQAERRQRKVKYMERNTLSKTKTKKQKQKKQKKKG